MRKEIKFWLLVLCLTFAGLWGGVGICLCDPTAWTYVKSGQSGAWYIINQSSDQTIPETYSDLFVPCNSSATFKVKSSRNNSTVKGNLKADDSSLQTFSTKSTSYTSYTPTIPANTEEVSVTKTQGSGSFQLTVAVPTHINFKSDEDNGVTTGRNSSNQATATLEFEATNTTTQTKRIYFASFYINNTLSVGSASSPFSKGTNNLPSSGNAGWPYAQTTSNQKTLYKADNYYLEFKYTPPSSYGVSTQTINITSGSSWSSTTWGVITLKGCKWPSFNFGNITIGQASSSESVILKQLGLSIPSYYGTVTNYSVGELDGYLFSYDGSTWSKSLSNINPKTYGTLYIKFQPNSGSNDYSDKYVIVTQGDETYKIKVSGTRKDATKKTFSATIGQAEIGNVPITLGTNFTLASATVSVGNSDYLISTNGTSGWSTQLSNVTSKTIHIKYQPSDNKANNGDITITSDGKNYKFAVSGTYQKYNLTTSATIGQAKDDTWTMTNFTALANTTNPTAATVTVGSKTVSGSSKTIDYFVSNNGSTWGTSATVSDGQTLHIKFQPSDISALHSGDITVKSGDKNYTFTVSGEPETAELDFTASETEVASKSNKQDFTMTNFYPQGSITVAKTTNFEVSSGGTDFSQSPITVNTSTKTYSVRFAPTIASGSDIEETIVMTDGTSKKTYSLTVKGKPKKIKSEIEYDNTAFNNWVFQTNDGAQTITFGQNKNIWAIKKGASFIEDLGMGSGSYTLAQGDIGSSDNISVSGNQIIIGVANADNNDYADVNFKVTFNGIDNKVEPSDDYIAVRINKRDPSFSEFADQTLTKGVASTLVDPKVSGKATSETGGGGGYFDYATHSNGSINDNTVTYSEAGLYDITATLNKNTVYKKGSTVAHFKVQPTAFGTTELGSSSANQSFTIADSRYSGAVRITATSDFEISADGSTDWGNQIDIDVSSQQTFYVRFSPLSGITGDNQTEDKTGTLTIGTAGNVTVNLVGKAKKKHCVISANAISHTASEYGPHTIIGSDVTIDCEGAETYLTFAVEDEYKKYLDFNANRQLVIYGADESKDDDVEVPVTASLEGTDFYEAAEQEFIVTISKEEYSTRIVWTEAFKTKSTNRSIAVLTRTKSSTGKKDAAVYNTVNLSDYIAYENSTDPVPSDAVEFSVDPTTSTDNYTSLINGVLTLRRASYPATSNPDNPKYHFPVKLIVTQKGTKIYKSQSDNMEFYAGRVTPYPIWTSANNYTLLNSEGKNYRYNETFNLSDYFTHTYRFLPEGETISLKLSQHVPAKDDDPDYYQNPVPVLWSFVESNKKVNETVVHVDRAGSIEVISITLAGSSRGLFSSSSTLCGPKISAGGSNDRQRKISITFDKALNNATWTALDELQVGKPYDIAGDKIVTTTRNEDGNAEIDKSTITYSSNDGDVAQVNNGKLTLIKGGVFGLTVTDHGDNDFYEAVPDDQTSKTFVAKPAYRIDFGTVAKSTSAETTVDLTSILALKASSWNVYTTDSHGNNGLFKVFDPLQQQYMTATDENNAVLITDPTNVKVQFNPTTANTYTGTLVVVDAIGTQSYNLKIEMTGVCWDPQTVEFGSASNPIDVSTASTEYDFGNNNDLRDLSWANDKVVISSSNPYVFRVYVAGYEDSNSTAINSSANVTLPAGTSAGNDGGIFNARMKYVPETANTSGETGYITIQYVEPSSGLVKKISLPVKGYSQQKTVSFSSTIGSFPEKKVDLTNMVSKDGYTVSVGNSNKEVFRLEKGMSDLILKGSSASFKVEFYPLAATTQYSDYIKVTDKTTGKLYQIAVEGLANDNIGDCGTSTKGVSSATQPTFQISGAGLPADLSDFLVAPSNSHFSVDNSTAQTGVNYTVTFTPKVKQTPDITGTIYLIDNTVGSSPISYPVYSVKGKCDKEKAYIRCDEALNNMLCGSSVTLHPYIVDADGVTLATTPTFSYQRSDLTGTTVNGGVVTASASPESGTITISGSGVAGYDIQSLQLEVNVVAKQKCYAVNSTTSQSAYLGYKGCNKWGFGQLWCDDEDRNPYIDYAPPGKESTGWTYNVSLYNNTTPRPLGKVTVNVAEGSAYLKYKVIVKNSGNAIATGDKNDNETGVVNPLINDVAVASGYSSASAVTVHLNNYNEEKTSGFNPNYTNPDYKITINSVQITQAQYLTSSNQTPSSAEVEIGKSGQINVVVNYSAWDAIQSTIVNSTEFSVPSSVNPPQCGCGTYTIPVTYTPSGSSTSASSGTLRVTGSSGTFDVSLSGTWTKRSQQVDWSTDQVESIQLGKGNITLSASSDKTALSGEKYGTPVVTLNQGDPLPIKYEIVSGPGTIVNDNELKPTGVGKVVVRAKQNGTNFTNPTTSTTWAEKEFDITKAQRSVEWNNRNLVVTSATDDIDFDASTVDKDNNPITSDVGIVTYTIVSGTTDITGQSFKCVDINSQGKLEIKGSGKAVIKVEFKESTKYLDVEDTWTIIIKDEDPDLDITPSANITITSTDPNVNMWDYIALNNYTGVAKDDLNISVSDPPGVAGVVSITDDQHLRAFSEAGQIKVPCTVEVPTRWLSNGSHPIKTGFVEFAISKGTLKFGHKEDGTSAGGGLWTDATKWSRQDIVEDYTVDGNYSAYNVEIFDSCFIGKGKADAETEADFLTHTVNASCNNLTIANSGKAKLVIGEASTLDVKNNLMNANADRFLLTANYWGQASVVFNNGSAVDKPKATIEMYVPEGNGSNTDPVWQYRGVAVDGFEMAGGPWNCMAIYRWDEAGNGNYKTGCWNVVTNGGVTSGLSLQPWVGYAFANICAAPYDTATWLTYKGNLINTKKDVTLSYTPGTNNESETFANVGINLITNSFAVPLKIDKLGYPADSEKGVILYNAGSHTDYRTAGGEVHNQRGNKGQYSTVPQNTGSQATDITTIPSGQGFFVKAVQGNAEEGHTLHINYGNDFYKIAPSDRMYMPALGDEPEFNILKINVISNKDSVSDRLYLVECETCTRHFDNGYDGKKMIGDEGLPQLYAYNKFGITAVNADSTFNKQYIGFNAGSDDESYTISFETDKLFGYHSLYLVDRKQNQSVDILAGETYTFKGYSVGENMRFQINGVTEEEWQNQEDPDYDNDYDYVCDLRVIGGQLYVQGFTTFDYPAATIELFDMTGNLVWSTPLTAERLYDLPSLPHGIYTIRLGDCHVKFSSMR